jgi:transposase-like protein
VLFDRAEAAVAAETMQPGMSISYVARRHGLSPSLLFRWRRLIRPATPTLLAMKYRSA